MTEIIEHFHRVDIDCKTFFSQQITKGGIPPPSLMPRHVKRNEACPLHLFQSLEYRGAILCQIHDMLHL